MRSPVRGPQDILPVFLCQKVAFRPYFTAWGRAEEMCDEVRSPRSKGRLPGDRTLDTGLNTPQGRCGEAPGQPAPPSQIRRLGHGESPMA